MPEVKLLDKSVYELIAAGEVIERPASVVKELIENALDAGATNIQLDIRHGGTTRIRVTDNGCGLAKEDCSTAFLRHATSKVSTEEDLLSIGTLGFRGEALASVCAVAKVELVSKRPRDPLGTRYVIEGGEEKLLEPAGCPDGTTITVSDLFYNVPARMKFLKKDSTEGNAVHDVVDKLALSHPEVAFDFCREGKPVLQTPGSGALLDAVYAVFGKEFARSLMPVSGPEGDIAVHGFVSKPMSCRPNRSMQYFFVNGRYVRTKTCTVALEEAFKTAKMIGKFPACVLFLQMPANGVDINVHPAKIEVRYTDERRVLQAVYTAVKAALAQHNQLPPAVQTPTHVQRSYFTEKAIGSEQTVLSKAAPIVTAPPKPANTGKTPPVCTFQSSIASYSAQEDRFAGLPLLSGSNKKPRQPVSPRIIPEKPPEASSDIPVQDSPERTPNISAEPPLPPQPSIHIIGELFRTYILAEVGDNFVVVDKHAAHERILYEKLIADNADLERQLLLAPLPVTLSRTELRLALDNLDALLHLGFLAEDFGGCSVLIREIPKLLDKADCKQVFVEIIQNLSDGKQDLSPQTLDHLYHTMACKAAIKAHDDNSPEELRALFEEVYFNGAIRTCPHGRPVVLTFTRERFERQFGR